MTYLETIDWLFSQLPMYQNLGEKAYTAKLDNIKQFVTHLNHPHQQFKTIHIGGTNGKGSSAHMLSAILQDAGYRVGLYTSPHLIDFRERIKINGKMISKQAVINFVRKHQTFMKTQQLSFFEMTVGMAFDYFAKQKVALAIIEVGLGGRLDSTNIINPILTIITNISLDHTAILGNDLASIAQEKAGIIKKNTPIIIGEKNIETDSIFIKRASELNAPISFAPTVLPKHNFISDLKGDYQYHNIRTVLTALHYLQPYFKLNPIQVKNALQNVVLKTNFKGRWQILQKKPIIICDTAHNVAGIKSITNQLKQLKYNKLHLILGFVKDKEVAKILDFFPNEAIYYFSAPQLDRKLAIDSLKQIAHKPQQHFFQTLQEAFIKAKENALTTDVIFIGGSTFVVAEILANRIS